MVDLRLEASLHTIRTCMGEGRFVLGLALSGFHIICGIIENLCDILSCNREGD